MNGCLLFIALKAISTIFATTYNNSVTNINGPFILYADERIEHSFANGSTYSKVQNDGNFVLQLTDGPVLWRANTRNEEDTNYAQFLVDGNLQVMDSNDNLLWETGTTGHDNGHPHTFVVADKCAYIMDRDNNIYWTSSTDPRSDCSAYPLDLIIHKSSETLPVVAQVYTSLYGHQSTTANTYHNPIFDGSQIPKVNTIYDWGITQGNAISGMYNNTLYIKDWKSDMNMDGLQPVTCDPFVLNDNDYIIGYRIYDSIDYIHGIVFYTSLGCSYECFGEADSGERGGISITDHGIVSYYYAVDDFWYLTGFSGHFSSIFNTLELQFTHILSGTDLSTSDTLMCRLTSAPTIDPTSQPTSNPTYLTIGPTLQTFHPTVHPSLLPSVFSVNPTLMPSSHPTYLPTLVPTHNPTQVPTRGPSPHPTHNITPSRAQEREIFDTTNSVVIVSSSGAGSHAHDGSSNGDDMITIVAVAAVGVCLLCVLIVVFIYTQKTRFRKETHSYMKPQSSQMADVNVSKLSFAQGVNDTDIASSAVAQVEDDNKEEMDVHHQDSSECIAIRQWLADVVKLPMYYDHFIKNGYDQMDFIKDIEDKSELRDIGIKKPGHQTRIMGQIKLLIVKEDDTDMVIRSNSEDGRRETEGNEGGTGLSTMPQVTMTTMGGGESDESDVDMAVRKQFETDMGGVTDGFMMEDVSDHSDEANQ